MQIIEILSLKDADKCEQTVIMVLQAFCYCQEEGILGKYENPSYCMKLFKLQ